MATAAGLASRQRRSYTSERLLGFVRFNRCWTCDGIMLDEVLVAIIAAACCATDIPRRISVVVAGNLGPRVPAHRHKRTEQTEHIPRL
ncbi:unnamed protein product [Schistosoma mattheei]|uniref:Uncharacterized protein n=1 Tax=Schistosoma mattheei TaxID=31246 RepID=A0A183Q4A9_9TREM|nr:unnamed protein product [Schistosoma mattheei]